jgi:hypothetical protein
MTDVVDWIFYYPHPNFTLDLCVTKPYSESGCIGHLWNLAKEEEPCLADHIGRAPVMFYIVRSSFLYTTGDFSHLYSSHSAYLLNHSPPCSLAAEIGFGSNVMMAKGP